MFNALQLLNLACLQGKRVTFGDNGISPYPTACGVISDGKIRYAHSVHTPHGAFVPLSEKHIGFVAVDKHGRIADITLHVMYAVS